jgi:hypothetical protein
MYNGTLLATSQLAPGWPDASRIAWNISTRTKPRRINYIYPQVCAGVRLESIIAPECAVRCSCWAPTDCCTGVSSKRVNHQSILRRSKSAYIIFCSCSVQRAVLYVPLWSQSCLVTEPGRYRQPRSKPSNSDKTR